MKAQQDIHKVAAIAVINSPLEFRTITILFMCFVVPFLTCAIIFRSTSLRSAWTSQSELQIPSLGPLFLGSSSSTSSQLENIRRSYTHYISQLINAHAGIERHDNLEVAQAIVSESAKANIDPIFVAAIVRSESTFHKASNSNRGAQGLMQIKPSTADYIAGKTSGFTNPNQLHDPQRNIRLGLAYINYLRAKFGDNMERVLIAYNWGPGNLIKAMHGGAAIPSSAREYALKIMASHRSWSSDLRSNMAQYKYFDPETAAS